MLYKFFPTSERAWRAMFKAISGAKESVYLEMYIFTNDMVQYDFLALLKEKAKSGVRVRIVLDSLGSRDLGNDAIAGLKENGAELLFQSYFFHRTHRKILVVDQNVAFIGGVNLSQRFRFWNDLVVEVKGKKVLQSIISSFAKVYCECGGKDPMCIAQNKRVILNKARTWVIEHFPVKKNLSLKNIYKKQLGQAKENILLITPYFIPKRFLVVALHQAVLRGVRVEILLPRRVDAFIVDRINYFYMHKLAKLGVCFYVQPVMNHAKIMIIDQREGIVGSQNLDFLSFEWNNEIGVFLKDEDAVRELSEIAETWKKEAVLFDFKSYRPHWFDYALSPFIRIFSRIL